MTVTLSAVVARWSLAERSGSADLAPQWTGVATPAAHPTCSASRSSEAPQSHLEADALCCLQHSLYSIESLVLSLASHRCTRLLAHSIHTLTLSLSLLASSAPRLSSAPSQCSVARRWRSSRPSEPVCNRHVRCCCDEGFTALLSHAAALLSTVHVGLTLPDQSRPCRWRDIDGRLTAALLQPLVQL